MVHVYSRTNVSPNAVCVPYSLVSSVLRMIAFPGASCRVRREIEGEFAKYSVQMLLAAVECLNDAAVLIWQATGTPEEVAAANLRIGRLNDLAGIWRRAELYKNRVVAVYLQVLQALYEQAVPNGGSTGSGGTAYLTKYGNNRLVGDIGNVADLTVRAWTRVGMLFARTIVVWLIMLSIARGACGWT